MIEPTDADLDRIDDWLCQQVKQWMQAKGGGAETMWKRLAEAADALRALRRKQAAEVELVARTLFKARAAGYAPAPHWDQEPNPLRDECCDDAGDVVRALKQAAVVAGGEQVRSEASEPTSSEGGEEKT